MKLSEGHNADYWLKKIAYNRQRDCRNTKQLESEGWCVMRFWETDIKRAPQDAANIIHTKLTASASVSLSRSSGLAHVSGIAL